VCTNRRQFGGYSQRAGNHCWRETAWWRTQSNSNPSQQQNSLLTGKIAKSGLRQRRRHHLNAASIGVLSDIPCEGKRWPYNREIRYAFRGAARLTAPRGPSARQWTPASQRRDGLRLRLERRWLSGESGRRCPERDLRPRSSAITRCNRSRSTGSDVRLSEL
jgi:hypothetical protein